MVVVVVVRREPARYHRSLVAAQARVAELKRSDRPTPSNSRCFLVPPKRLRRLLRLPLPESRAQKVRIRAHPTRHQTSLYLRKRTSRSRTYLTTPMRTSSRVRLTPRKKIGVATLKIRLRILGALTLPRFLGLLEVGEGEEGGQHTAKLLRSHSAAALPLIGAERKVRLGEEVSHDHFAPEASKDWF